MPRCGACQFLRIKCTARCPYAPYFRRFDGIEEFEPIHRVFGNRNVGRMLTRTPVQYRQMVVDALRHEALNRINDPILGSYGIIRYLQQQVNQYEATIQNMQSEINNLQEQVNFLTNQAASRENMLNIRDNEAGPSRILPSNLPVGYDSSFSFGGNPPFSGSIYEPGSSGGQLSYQDPNFMGFNNIEHMDAQTHIYNQGAGQQVQYQEELSPLISNFIAPNVVSVPYTGPL